MKSFEEAAEGETSKSTQIVKSPSLRLTAKEMLASKTQNYLTQTKKTETILIQVAFSIGLGSMWRFPYLCHRTGGGDFILMYFFMLLLFGTPLLYMEMILGQWLQSSLGVWVTVLAFFTFLPILVYPLLRWWNLQDRVVSEAFEKMQLPRKPTVPPSKPSQWGRHLSTKTSFEPQEGQSESSLQLSNVPLARGSNLDSLWQFSMPWHWQSESSSRFSLPLIASLTSAFSGRGASPSPSKQVSRKPTAGP